MSLSKKQWDEIENSVSLWSSAGLLIDGYKVSISMIKYKMSLRYVLYVNGECRGKWLTTDCDIRRRFMRVCSRSLYSKKYQSDIVKIFGKKRATERGVFKKYQYYQWGWSSFSSLKRHLIKNNKSIELAK